MGKTSKEEQKKRLYQIMEEVGQEWMNRDDDRSHLASIYSSCYIALQLERIADALNGEGLPGIQRSLSDIRDAAADMEDHMLRIKLKMVDNE